MSEWDKLNRWQKAKITRYMLHGTSNLTDLRGPIKEESRKRMSEAHKKLWANYSPEEREKKLKQLAYARACMHAKRKRKSKMLKEAQDRTVEQ